MKKGQEGVKKSNCLRLGLRQTGSETGLYQAPLSG